MSLKEKNLRLIATIITTVTASTMLTFTTMATSDNSSATQEKNVGYISYEDCVTLADALDKDVSEVLKVNRSSPIPTKYIAFVSVKNPACTSGNITISLHYNSTYLNYTGRTNGSNGTITSYSSSMIGTGPWWDCAATASICSASSLAPSYVIATHEFEVVSGKKAFAYSDFIEGDGTAHNTLAISSTDIPSSSFSSYFEYGYWALGDVDGDTVITTADATKILNHISKLQTLTTKELAVADYDRDGVVDVSDVTAIYNALS